MTLVERYILRQLLIPIGWAVLALSAVALLSQSLSTLDIIVERGQSPWVLFKVTALALPRLLSMILPIAAFVGALLALNRMQTDNELVVASAGGLSRWRMFAPAMKIAAVLGVLTLFLNLWVQPVTYRAMHQQLFDARTEAAAIFVKEGQFVQAGDALTVYVQRIEQNGLLRNVFIHIQEDDGATTYTAQEGRITTSGGAPSLIMRSGSSQEFSNRGVLNYLAFDDYVFDLTPFMGTARAFRLKTSDRWLHELFYPNLQLRTERRDANKLYAEGHSRIAAAIYPVTFMALALVGVLGGAFSRLGYGRNIARVAVIAIVVRIAGFGVQPLAESVALLNVLQYLVPIVPIVWAFRTLFRQKVRRPVPLACDQDSLLPAGAA